MIIPKVIHFIWLGSAVPDWAATNIESWRQLHPGYEIKVWMDDNLPGMVNRELFDKVPSASQKSDVLRYELLYQFGGIYCDTDVICYKNIEGIVDGFDSFSGSQDEAEIAVACMGSVPEHRMFKMMLNRLPFSVAASDRRDLVSASGPGFFTRNFNRWVDYKFTHVDCWHNPARCSMRIFPPEYFYPVHWSGKVFGKREDAYAEHQWKFSWQPYHAGIL